MRPVPSRTRSDQRGSSLEPSSGTACLGVMRFFRRFGPFVLALVLVPSMRPSLAAIQAQGPGASAANPDVGKLGPQPGQPVPDFSLPDQRGQTRTLRSLMGPNGLMLVFARSADW